MKHLEPPCPFCHELGRPRRPSWLAVSVVLVLGAGQGLALTRPPPPPVECPLPHGWLHVVPGLELASDGHASVDCVRQVLQVEGWGHVWGIGHELQVTVDGVRAELGIQQDRFFWRVELPASERPYLHGHWQDLLVVASSPHGQWSRTVRASIVDGRAFAHPYQEDGALRDVAVGADVGGALVVRGRITGCSPEAVLEVASSAGEVRGSAQPGPFQLLLPRSFSRSERVTVSLREPGGQVARVTRRVAAW